jgi:uncharacterized membrane protein HdeD (DUF308 family)
LAIGAGALAIALSIMIMGSPLFGIVALAALVIGIPLLVYGIRLVVTGISGRKEEEAVKSPHCLHEIILYNSLRIT